MSELEESLDLRAYERTILMSSFDPSNVSLSYRSSLIVPNIVTFSDMLLYCGIYSDMLQSMSLIWISSYRIDYLARISLSFESYLCFGVALSIFCGKGKLSMIDKPFLLGFGVKLSDKSVT